MATKIHTFSFSFFLILLLSSHQGFAQNEEEEIKRSDFPENFLFGTATSSYQIEGGYDEDGRGLSNWDVFSHIPGKIKNNDTGDVADDHYHRFLEDIELMHSMGMNAYRFSISWTRILPRGRFGKVNKRGITFYNKIIDHLLFKGIEPFVTLHHQDFPIELERRYESWMSSQMQDDFVYYAKICFKKFGDRVKYWMTINEPNLIANMGYKKGSYPPAHCSQPFGNCSMGNSDREPLIVVHNQLLAHAKAVQLYRTHFQGKQGGSIGIVTSMKMYEPLDQQLDTQAVDTALAFHVGWINDPIVYGDYPKEMREILGSELPSFSDEEKKCIKGSLDFISINHYTTSYAKDCFHSSCSDKANRPINAFVETTGYRDGILIGDPMGMPDFYVVPSGMEKAINYIKERYPNQPIFVTENGYSMPLSDGNKVENIVNDLKRIKYHKSYLAALARAMRNGGDVRGYFAWSLMDNFEWTRGYDTRFGLFYVDLQTLERRPKISAHWFSSFLGGYPQELAQFSSIKNANAFDSAMVD